MHSVFESQWMKGLLLAGIRIPYTDRQRERSGRSLQAVRACGTGMVSCGAERVSQRAVDDAGLCMHMLSRCLDMLPSEQVKVPLDTLEAASVLFPTHSNITNGVIAREEAAANRQREMVRDYGTFHGTERQNLHPLALNWEGETQHGGDRAMVSTGYATGNAYLDTYTHLERGNFTYAMREAVQTVQDGRPGEGGDMVRMESVWVQAICKSEKQRSLELLLCMRRRGPEAPRDLYEFGQMILMSNDGWRTYIAFQSLGSRYDHERGCQRRRKNKEATDPAVRYTTTRMGREQERNRQGGSVTQVVVTPLAAYSSVSGPAFDRVLSSECEGALFGDALLLGYQPVFETLQRLKPGDVPFAPVLTGLERGIKRPGYMRQSTRVDMSYLYSKGEGEECVRVLDIGAPWPGEEGGPPMAEGVSCIADPTQLKAIRHTLSHQVAVIRGGPGTGKSYTAKLILRHLYDSFRGGTLGGPVLLITMTNQALDTLMEGILEFADESHTLRIGGTTKSMDLRLAARQLSEIREEMTVGYVDKKLYSGRERAVKAVSEATADLLISGRGGMPLGSAISEIQGMTDKISEEQCRSLAKGIRKAGVVFLGMTSTAAAKNMAMLSLLRPSVCVVEEAGELREGQMIASMPSSLQQLILIGDEQQLQPKVEHFLKIPPVNYGWSMFERLTRMGIPRVQLRTQRRMRPEICGLMNHAFDQGLLTDKPASLIVGPRPALRQPVFFLTHRHREGGAGNSRSHVNIYESQMIVGMIPLLCANGYTPNDITIVSLYKGQMRQLQRDLDDLSHRIRAVEADRPSYQVLGGPVEMLQRLKIVTLDDFQGQENKVILVSLTRSDRLGFVAERNRALVTLSRAKEVLIVLGHELFLETRNQHWMRIMEYFRAGARRPSPTECPFDSTLVGMGPGLPVGCPQHGTQLVYSDPSQLDVGHGHVGVPTDYTFSCGHSKTIPCGEASPSTPCPFPCGKQMHCGHACLMPCGHEGPCDEASCTVECDTRCGTCRGRHSLPCNVLREKGSESTCPLRCSHRLPCGHNCEGVCGECTVNGGHKDCTRTVDYRHPRCGHRRTMPCAEALTRPDCTEKCGRGLGSCHHKCGLACGHRGMCECNDFCDIATCTHGSCPAPCGVECPKCTEPCPLGCKHSRCTQLCHEACDRFACDEPCDTPLKCGCRCRGLCGETCVPCRTHNSNAYTGNPIKYTNEKLGPLYYISTCNHVIAVRKLDSHVRESMNRIRHSRGRITSIKCPFHKGCNTVLTVSNAPRYQRVLRELLEERREAARRVFAKKDQVDKEAQADKWALNIKAAGGERVRLEDAIQTYQTGGGISRKDYERLAGRGRAVTQGSTGGYDWRSGSNQATSASSGSGSVSHRGRQSDQRDRDNTQQWQDRGGAAPQKRGREEEPFDWRSGLQPNPAPPVRAPPVPTPTSTPAPVPTYTVSASGEYQARRRWASPPKEREAQPTLRPPPRMTSTPNVSRPSPMGGRAWDRPQQGMQIGYNQHMQGSRGGGYGGGPRAPPQPPRRQPSAIPPSGYVCGAGGVMPQQTGTQPPMAAPVAPQAKRQPAPASNTSIPRQGGSSVGNGWGGHNRQRKQWH
ncbi:hypothetical protein KIPB_005389 [Kipferlia bialata]|uniref:AAA+ ATPase domain-containing protein n=1 Tax=Kipferlia bialata TaxID=797122 RepID=A0A9K3CXE2_9EUKA|nr:hypothetical protein KIPB_005389 [Kipferlia bialata]|eukprot:g5389.t1